MRIAFGTFQRGLLNTLGNIGTALARSTAHLSSGRRITSASDDGSGSAHVAVVREDLTRIDARRRTIDIARGFLGATDAALESAQDLIRSGIVEGVKGLSGTNASVRAEIAVQVDSLREQMLRNTRTQYQDRYVFAGTATLTDPFDAGGNYLGNAGTMQAAIDDQLTLAVNLSGDAIFKNGVDILGAFENMSVALRAGDEPGMRAAQDELVKAVDQIASGRVQAGVRMQALDAAELSLLAREAALRGELSRVEDADIPAEVTSAARLQTASQATMTILARVGNRNLFDFLA